MSNITSLEKKSKALEMKLRKMGSVIVAYSGGVDSTFLSVSANRVLGSKAVAVTAKSPSLAPSELKNAEDVAQKLGLNHRVIETKEVERTDYQSNTPNRCFFCKDELYTNLKSIASEYDFKWIANGTNTDDLVDFRPGLNAAKRHGVRSPLLEAELSKSEVRTLSHNMDIPTWDKPSQACLSSRIPYGSPISNETLTRIAQAEEFILSLGIKQTRVRHHDSVARIEIAPSDFHKLTKDSIHQSIASYFRSIGYAYVALDLEGFRSGSLNETLNPVKSPPKQISPK